MSRCNLRDAVSDLAPPSPMCFLNRTQWREYLASAAAAQNVRGEPKVIIIVNGEPTFNFDYPFCADCTQMKSYEMNKKGMCDPNFLRKQAQEIGITRGNT